MERGSENGGHFRSRPARWRPGGQLRARTRWGLRERPGKSRHTGTGGHRCHSPRLAELENYTAHFHLIA